MMLPRNKPENGGIATYLGGEWADIASGIAVSGSGEAYLRGEDVTAAVEARVVGARRGREVPLFSAATKPWDERRPAPAPETNREAGFAL